MTKLNKAREPSATARMIDVLSGVYDPPLCQPHSFGIQQSPLTYYYDAMEHLDLKTLKDIPAEVMSSLDRGMLKLSAGEPRKFQDMILDLQFDWDYRAALGPFYGDSLFGRSQYDYEKGALPGADSPFLADPGLVREFAKTSGLKSIFEKWRDSGSPDWGVKPARRNLLERYYKLLVEKDDPAYPASQVRIDYFNAAAHGADLRMPTWGDKIDLMIERRLSFLLPDPR